MRRFLFSRRAFLLGGLGTGVGVLGAPPWSFFENVLAGPSDAPRAAPRTRVLELHSSRLRGPEGRLQATALEDLLMFGAMSMVAGDLPPLDAFAEIFGEEPPVAILVDARAGSESTRILATHLARSLLNMGSGDGLVTILDRSDEDLVAGGYTLSRGSHGLLCHGTGPEPGYEKIAPAPKGGPQAGLSKSATGKGMRLAVVGKLGMRDKGMGPFVLDAALRAFDEPTHAKALADPSFGARLLSSEEVGGRVALVLGDLSTIPLALSDGKTDEGEPSKAGKEKRLPASWNADVILVGTNLFAVERIGHRILANTREAFGKSAPVPHPILSAAEGLGLAGAGMESIVWRKVAS